MVDLNDSTLNAYSYVAIVIFLLVIVLVIRPIKFRVGKHIKIYLNISTAPPLGVLILLICRAIDFDVVGKGFLGTLGVQPWAIMILFYSLAYICISLDMTGVFQFCAFWVSRKAGHRGVLAFTLFFILTSLMSGLTSNDVVILTGTVFLSYFTKVSDIHPTAFLMSEFTTANIASMALYIGNPTNVVVSEAYDISFINYSAWMLLPTVICILVAYIVLRLLFRSDYYLPRHINPPDADPKSVLIDPHGAVFGLILLACCLITLVATSFASVPVWMVTLPFAVVMFLRDVRHDLGISFSHLFPCIKKQHPRPMFNTVPHDHALTHELTIIREQDTHQLDTLSLPSSSSHPKNSVVQQEDALRHRATPTLESQPLPDDKETRKQQQQQQQQQHAAFVQPLFNTYAWFSRRFPTLAAVMLRMPWSILPFSLGMFILIEALAQVGWVGIFAKAMAVFAKNYATAVLGTVFVSILACQLLNNLPMTILFTQIIQHPNFTQHITSEATLQGFLLGLIVGSNLGACFTLVGSLAGIMFDHILKTKGIYTLGYFQFLKWNLIIMPILALTASAVLIGEIWFIYIK